jgi:hypothetical protein
MKQIIRTFGLTLALLAPASFPPQLCATGSIAQEETDPINPITAPKGLVAYHQELDKIAKHLTAHGVTFQECLHVFKYALNSGLMVEAVQPLRGGKLHFYPQTLQAVQAAKKTLPHHLAKCLTLRNTFLETYFTYRKNLLALQILTECNKRYSNRAYTSMREEPIEAALDGTVLRVFDCYLNDIEAQAQHATPTITLDDALAQSNQDATQQKLVAIVLGTDQKTTATDIDLIEQAGFKAALKCFLFSNLTLTTYCSDLTRVQNLPKAENGLYAQALRAEYVLATLAFQKSLMDPEGFKAQITKTEQDFITAAKTFVDSGVLKQKSRSLMATWFIPQELLPNSAVTLEPQATPGQ